MAVLVGLRVCREVLSSGDFVTPLETTLLPQAFRYNQFILRDEKLLSSSVLCSFRKGEIGEMVSGWSSILFHRSSGKRRGISCHSTISCQLRGPIANLNSIGLSTSYVLSRDTSMRISACIAECGLSRTFLSIKTHLSQLLSSKLTFPRKNP
jgi:hypothetical protein